VQVTLKPITAAAAKAIAERRVPDGVSLAPDYPTEFSLEVMQQVGGDSALGPYFVEADGVVVGEIGGASVGPGTVMIGYALVRSVWGRGIATAAARALVEIARALADVERLVAHTPVDRPASARVLEKAGFAFAGEVEDDVDGRVVRVRRWERSAR
jgi:RimJ/RimL family protein N-acetyltransferase